MGQLQERMAADLEIGGYSPNTRKIYLLHVRNFVGHFGRSPAELGAEEIRAYLVHLVRERKASRETIRQVRAALRFLYRVTLDRPLEIDWLPVPRKGKRVPVVLSGTEVLGLFEAVRSAMYRCIIMAMYGGGLRISEACALRPTDIDSRRMLIRVLGKGDTERYTVLPKSLLSELRTYWRESRPEGDWLFPGGTRAGHISDQSARKVFHQARADAGIRKPARPHSLRHSFATHLVETGVDIAVVKELLGHKSLKSTEIYARATVPQITRTTSPLDLLATPRGRILA